MRKLITMLSSMAIFFVFSSMVVASVNDDQVTSQKIREADGTSGQNTNSGSGAKTGHIQDGAVTTGKIADGAVTDAKIAGPISASKVSSTGLNADTVDGMHAADLAPVVHTHSQSQVTGLEASLAGKAEVLHNHDPLYQQKYGKIAVVAQTGGDYTNPVAAMNDLAAWCGTPSAANPCLVKVMPGVYNIGTSSLSIGDYVSLVGSGKESTRIVAQTSGEYYVAAVYLAGIGIDLRDIAIESYGNAIAATGAENAHINNVNIFAYDAPFTVGVRGAADLTRVKIHAEDRNVNSSYFVAGIHSPAGGISSLDSVIIEAVNGIATGGIAPQSGATVTVRNSVITSTQYGINVGGVMPNPCCTPSGPDGWSAQYGTGNSVKVYNTRISGSTASVRSISPGLRVAESQLEGPVSLFDMSEKLFNCFDAGFNAVLNQ